MSLLSSFIEALLSDVVDTLQHCNELCSCIRKHQLVTVQKPRCEVEARGLLPPHPYHFGAIIFVVVSVTSLRVYSTHPKHIHQVLLHPF